MKKYMLMVTALLVVKNSFAQSPVGRWKIISSTTIFDGKKIDMHAALLTRRPCAANIVYELNADYSYRLNASNSGCDEAYQKIQTRLYSNTKWKLTGNKITLSATNFAVGQTYTIHISGNKMTWKMDTDEITYLKL